MTGQDKATHCSSQEAGHHRARSTSEKKCAIDQRGNQLRHLQGCKFDEEIPPNFRRTSETSEAPSRITIAGAALARPAATRRRYGLLDEWIRSELVQW